LSELPPRFEDLVEFPVLFVFRAVGAAEADFPGRCVAALTAALGRPPTSHELRPSAGGRFVGVHLGAMVASADELRAVYAALQALEGVRVVL
jgi:putative lipoic acid-binding regulatory protein